MHLIVGLGNPGKVYEATRHNAGFLLVDRLAALYDLRFKTIGPAQICEGRICGKDVTIIKPQTFMNRSGEPVAALLERHPVPADAVIVAYDDCDLPFGRIRVRSSGSTGGHRGMESVTRILGSTVFPRVRLGIGRPAQSEGAPTLADYVLAPFDADELKGLDDMLKAGVACIETILRDGVTTAMNGFNSTGRGNPGSEGGEEKRTDA